MYRIENRPKGLTDQPVLYWNRVRGWEGDPDIATLYSAEEREGDPTLPDGGCWVMLGNSENYARKLDEADLVLIARNEVIAKAKLWANAVAGDYAMELQETREDELLASITLLESREAALPDEARLQQAMKDTEHLEEIRK